MIRSLGWMGSHLYRRALLGFGAGGFVISFLYGFAYYQAAGQTAAEQAAFGRAVTLAAKQFLFLIPMPVHPETLGGYEMYKWLGFAIEMFGVWAALAAAGIGRGDEDRGLTDEWLAAGLSRPRLLIMRSAAFLAVLLTVCLASTLGISAVAPLIKQDPNLAGEIGYAISMTAGISALYATALLLAQLPAERQTATAFGVGSMVVFLVVNGVANTIPSASWIGAVSPFHWMNRTSSAAPGGSFDLAAVIGLAVAATVLVLLSLPLYARRDLGAGVFNWGRASGPAVRTRSRNPALRAPFSEGLWEQRVGLAVWAAGTFLLGAIMVSVVKSLTDALVGDPRIGALFQRVFSGNPYVSMLGFVWLGFSLLVMASYAVVQVARWATLDEEGRVELLLSAPVSRTRVVVERALEFALASLVLVVAGYIGVALAIPGSGIHVGGRDLAAASFLLWPFALAFGGVGMALVSRWPRVAVPVLAGFAVVEYLVGDLGPIFKAPDWLVNLSVFHLFGNPLTGSVSWGPGISMIALAAAGLAIAVVLMRRRDVSGA